KAEAAIRIVPIHLKDTGHSSLEYLDVRFFPIKFTRRPFAIEFFTELLPLAFLLFIFGQCPVRRERKAFVHVGTVEMPESWSKSRRLVGHHPAHRAVLVDDHLLGGQGQGNSPALALDYGRWNPIVEIVTWLVQPGSHDSFESCPFGSRFDRLFRLDL